MRTTIENPTGKQPGSMTDTMNLVSALTRLLEDAGHQVRFVTVHRDPTCGDPVPLIWVFVREASDGSAWLLGLDRRGVQTQANGRSEITYRGLWQGADVALCAPLVSAGQRRDARRTGWGSE